MKKPWHYRPVIWALLWLMRVSDVVFAAVIWFRWLLVRIAGGTPRNSARCPMCGSRMVVIRVDRRIMHCWGCGLDCQE